MKTFALVLLACLSAPVARAAVLDASAAGFTLENQREVPVDAERAWNALVDDVDRWWPRDHTWWGKDGRLGIEARAGGCFCETDFTGRRQARHMQVVFVDPGRLLRLEGGLGPMQGMGLHGVMEFRFEPLGQGGTRITIWYRAGGYTPGDLAEFAPIVDRVMGLQLGGLAEHLGGSAGGEG